MEDQATYENTNTFRDYYEALFAPWLKEEFKDFENVTKDRFIKNPGIMASVACEYFIYCEEFNQPMSLITLILKLGLSSRASFDKYKNYEEYVDLIEVIKLVIEDWYFKGLFNANYYKAANFILKTNYKYSETITNIIENREYKIDINEPRKD